VEVFEDVRGIVPQPVVGYTLGRRSEDGAVLSHELLCVVGYPRVARPTVDRTLDGVDQPKPFPLGACPESVVVQPPEENPLLTSVKRHEEAVLDVDQERVRCVLSHLTRVRVVVRDRDREIGFQPSDKVRRERIRVRMWSSMFEAPIDEGLRQRRDVHIVRQTPIEQGKEHETPSLCRLAHQLHHPENLREEPLLVSKTPGEAHLVDGFLKMLVFLLSLLELPLLSPPSCIVGIGWRLLALVDAVGGVRVLRAEGRGEKAGRIQPRRPVGAGRARPPPAPCRDPIVARGADAGCCRCDTLATTVHAPHRRLHARKGTLVPRASSLASGSGRAPRASLGLVWDRVTAMVGGSTKTVWSDLATPVGSGGRRGVTQLW